MKRQGNMNPLKAHNPSVTESKYTEMAEMLDKEIKSLLKND
jgi:hypothetical protein